MSSSFDNSPTDPLRENRDRPTDQRSLAEELAEVEASLSRPTVTPIASPQVRGFGDIKTPPLTLVEVAFLASTCSLLWLVSYYLSIGPWMRILFPLPIALVYLRWGYRASWMSAVVCGLLLSVLMGPYLSLLFMVPYALLGVQLGMMWRRRSPWLPSIALGTLLSTLGFFFRLGILSIFLGEDLWAYSTNRVADLIQWLLSVLVGWGWLGLEVLGQTNLTAIQVATVGLILCSDVVYLFTVHLAAWLLLERLGNPIPEPPQWVQVLLEEE
ncbi:MAG: DUF2232 domain-containing protein [Oscillatoriophycideae cyanobacterium NC_groundwater_1537_Pr4_S-0.65um_50_18]|nr:DUF2232 domain-containing protein [Oscillatoriophycideae cyanobacterium NC_groundwater_1537_Pr4_S-0.65um_50_18]